MQRPPERLSLVKRDGRLVGFSAPRLVGSLCRALEAVGRREPGLAGDLARVVEASLVRRGASRPVTAADVALLAGEVLVSAGCESAAHAYRVVAEQRRLARAALRIAGGDGPSVRAIPPACAPDATVDPEAWSKGRVVALLSTESGLAEAEAADVAASVERGLFASGLTSVSPGLLREWIDNELRLRGLPPRAGRSGSVGLAGHELRELLSGGGPALDAEAAATTRLLERHARTEVFPPDVRRAHDQGLLCLEDLAGAGRVDTLALPAWSLPAVGNGPGRRARLRALGPVLRNLGRLAVREVVLVWDGPALAADAAADLLAGLAEPPLASGRAARLVLSLPAERPGLSAAFLAALESSRWSSRRGMRLVCLRLPAAGLDPDGLERAARLEGVDGRVQFATSDPEPGLIGSSVAVNLARAALDSGP
ncbi:MAG TPA: ATP cone domain-containing protein, partial [Planctomycetota bacterium]|nr:ATP cone domain-containing protein [Planctomycetota bacterium]